MQNMLTIGTIAAKKGYARSRRHWIAIVDKFIITEENDNMLVTQLTKIAIYIFSTVANRIEVKTKA